MYHCTLGTLETSRSLATDFDSHVIDCKGMDWVGIEYSYTGVSDNTGSLVVEQSLTGANWQEFSETKLLTATLDCGFFWINVGAAFKLRLKYTANTNSTGSITVIYGTKTPRDGDAPGGA